MCKCREQGRQDLALDFMRFALGVVETRLREDRWRKDRWTLQENCLGRHESKEHAQVRSKAIRAPAAAWVAP
eukprot:11994027-Karenia_brevis.AAC.1